MYIEIDKFTYKGKNLKDILDDHKLWLSEPAGQETHERAHLKGAYLKWANLKWANLEGANLEGANLEGANLKWANLKRANLKWAYLKWANLKWAYLEGVYLEGANLKWACVDFSCWPLWCGSKGVKVDKNIAAQLAAHFCVLDCDDPEYIKARDAIMEFAKTSHRASDLGLI